MVTIGSRSHSARMPEGPRRGPPGLHDDTKGQFLGTVSRHRVEIGEAKEQGLRSRTPPHGQRASISPPGDPIRLG